MAQPASFDFQLCYRPETTNQNADALSQMPTEVNISLVEAKPLP